MGGASCGWASSFLTVCVCVCSSQAVKFECHLKNALVMFLLSRAQANVNIAHHLYW